MSRDYRHEWSLRNRPGDVEDAKFERERRRCSCCNSLFRTSVTRRRLCYHCHHGSDFDVDHHDAHVGVTG